MWNNNDSTGPTLHMETDGNDRFSMVKAVSLDDLQDYIEGRLTGGEVARVEAYLHAHPAKQAQVDAMKRQASRLRKLGEDILSEPIPSQFLDILKRLPK
jgi:anti-sigma factor RsiW